MSWDISLQALWRVMPLLGILAVQGVVIGLTVLITWVITRRYYWGRLEREVDNVSNNLIERYENKVRECNDVKEKLKEQKVIKKEIRALLVKALEKTNL